MKGLLPRTLFITQHQTSVHLTFNSNAQNASVIRYASSQSTSKSPRSATTKSTRPKKAVQASTRITAQQSAKSHDSVAQIPAETAVISSLKKSISSSPASSDLLSPAHDRFTLLKDGVDHLILPGDSRIFNLPDGRQLGYAIYGSRSKRAQVVLAHHGTPGSRLGLHFNDAWGRKNDVTFICPERPGYGLSTFTKEYTVLEYAHDVHMLMEHLGHRQYKVYGVSGGAPYALASTHVASCSHHDVTGTILVAPTSPFDAPKAGQSFKRSFRQLSVLLFPTLEESSQQELIEAIVTLDTKFGWPLEKLRMTFEGKKHIRERETYNNVKGVIYDRKSLGSYWGFELHEVAARRIVIFAGGMDQNTTLPGMRYMRNRLRECELQEYPAEDHYSLQERYRLRILDMLKNI